MYYMEYLDNGREKWYDVLDLVSAYPEYSHSERLAVIDKYAMTDLCPYHYCPPPSDEWMEKYAIPIQERGFLTYKKPPALKDIRKPNGSLMKEIRATNRLRHRTKLMDKIEWFKRKEK